MLPATPAPTPPPADRTVICVGDIHGHLSKIRRLWCNLEAAVGPSAFSTATVIFLGDYCDRGPDTRGVISFLCSLPSLYPSQRHIFLCGNHDLAFAAFVHALPLPSTEDGAVPRMSDTWREYEHNEEKERWYREEGYERMHVQGRRWGGVMKGFNVKKGMGYKGSIYDAEPTFLSYGVPHGSPDLVKAVPDEHKEFLRDLVWVHEEENVPLDAVEGRIHCRMIAVHAGLQNKTTDEQLKVLKSRDVSLPKVTELSGRQDVLQIPEDLSPKPTIVISGHHGKLHIEGFRYIIDEGGGFDHLPVAAVVFPFNKIVRDTDTIEHLVDTDTIKH